LSETSGNCGNLYWRPRYTADWCCEGKKMRSRRRRRRNRRKGIIIIYLNQCLLKFRLNSTSVIYKASKKAQIKYK
jgi:hypothetical protein